eukprot:CAMPEP_0179281442 /NCGR_PEP_ID=MMETSP0797-20121207/37154_1 /TAXON_ID=47934 /ORGANISM="Dinophysis acuminata, Strain DAEP01" /LENGTH=132 /DNA_ID=CAMNT_0020990147 /DNA_START=26 /DNA_END=424 /DNA_ORIENTATION=+
MGAFDDVGRGPAFPDVGQHMMDPQPSSIGQHHDLQARMRDPPEQAHMGHGEPTPAIDLSDGESRCIGGSILLYLAALCVVSLVSIAAAVVDGTTDELGPLPTLILLGLKVLAPLCWPVFLFWFCCYKPCCGD